MDVYVYVCRLGIYVYVCGLGVYVLCSVYVG